MMTVVVISYHEPSAHDERRRTKPLKAEEATMI
jgi:hypothetical protein